MPLRRMPESFLCKGCDQTITRAPSPARDRRKEYCSLACKMKIWWSMHSKDLYPPKARIKNPRFCICGAQLLAKKRYCSNCLPRVIYKPRAPRTYQCEICRAVIVMKMGARKRWCSRLCYQESPEWKVIQRAARVRRKARERGNPSESIDPYAVFNRDAWRCQLCGCDTPKRLRGQMVDTAPELDHIIPLASGGAHVWDNVQCTCRKCNGEKGAEVLGQLRLGLNGIVERSIEVDVVRGVTQHIRSWRLKSMRP
jgi:5-methylcytosine-specific restriction endonuclease McrA